MGHGPNRLPLWCILNVLYDKRCTHDSLCYRLNRGHVGLDENIYELMTKSHDYHVMRSQTSNAELKASK